MKFSSFIDKCLKKNFHSGNNLEILLHSSALGDEGLDYTGDIEPVGIRDTILCPFWPAFSVPTGSQLEHCAIAFDDIYDNRLFIIVDKDSSFIWKLFYLKMITLYITSIPKRLTFEPYQMAVKSYKYVFDSLEPEEKLLIELDKSELYTLPEDILECVD